MVCAEAESRIDLEREARELARLHREPYVVMYFPFSERFLVIAESQLEPPDFRRVLAVARPAGRGVKRCDDCCPGCGRSCCPSGTRSAAWGSTAT